VTDARLPPALGAVANLGYAFLVGVPYLLVPAERAGALGTYYAFGPIALPVLALFALVGAIAFGAAMADRTDRATAAGAVLVVGVAVFGFTLYWALAVDFGTLATMPADWLDVHRWGVLSVASIPPLAAAWYTRVLGLF
jgi:hypothetical protein